MVTLVFPAERCEFVARTDPVTYTRPGAEDVYLGTGQDGGRGRRDFAVSFTPSPRQRDLSVTQPNIEVTIEDDETQTYVLLTVTTDEARGGDSLSNVTLKADPAHDKGSVMLTLHLDDPTYSVGDDPVTIDGRR